MKIIHGINEMRAVASALKRKGEALGFVPTMGALHEGHRALIRRARSENDVVAVSIFVNPLQFGPQEDLQRYPRTLDHDKKILREEEVDILFAPSPGEMFPPVFSTAVEVSGLTSTLCGPFRPGHFQGVATVVAKLLSIVDPERAYFGEKDYQQLRVIYRMVQDLSLGARIIGCPTVREKDGLACSSRNRYLSRHERDEAVKLYQALYLGRELVALKIMNDAAKIVKRLKNVLQTIPRVRIDYVSFVDPTTLEPLSKVRRPALLAAAIWIGKTRLIDNVIIS